MDPEFKKGKQVFSDDECRQMFNDMDKKKDDALEKFEMATFLCRFINNKELYQQNSEFVLKIKELKSHLEQEISQAIKQIKLIEKSKTGNPE